MNNEQFNNSKVNVLGVKFNNTTMLEMIENIKSFSKIKLKVIYL